MQRSIFKRRPATEPLRSILLNRKAELRLALELQTRRFTGSAKDGCLYDSTGAAGAERLRRVLCAKLRRIEEALNRMDSGSFGACIVCGGAISEERLRLLPWETHCTVCQQTKKHGVPQPSAPVETPVTESPIITVALAKPA